MHLNFALTVIAFTLLPAAPGVHDGTPAAAAGPDAIYLVERWSGTRPEKWRLVGRPKDTLEEGRAAFDRLAATIERGAVRLMVVDPDAPEDQELQRYAAPSTARRRR